MDLVVCKRFGEVRPEHGDMGYGHYRDQCNLMYSLPHRHRHRAPRIPFQRMRSLDGQTDRRADGQTGTQREARIVPKAMLLRCRPRKCKCRPVRQSTVLWSQLRQAGRQAAGRLLLTNDNDDDDDDSLVSPPPLSTTTRTDRSWPLLLTLTTKTNTTHIPHCPLSRTTLTAPRQTSR